MKVVLAETAGFCIGVKRALEMVLKAINENQPQIYTYGPLIHNPQVLELLRERGIRILKPGEEIPAGLVVIRAHGIPLQERRLLEQAGAQITYCEDDVGHKLSANCLRALEDYLSSPEGAVKD